ncbi:MAG TPA: MBL fold metallo-hydrolase [Terriglobia bacterium]|nr:MBL fold metallo-hydrolase [Terriglobia bacterium]
MKLGSLEIVALSDGTFRLDGGQMFGVVPKILWEKKLPADELNRVTLGLTCLLVKAGHYHILIETGIGDKFDAKFARIYGANPSTILLDDLARHGLRPEDVDIVINSHLHFDHCGWNTRREGSRTLPTFPRARYFVQRGEWEHALNPTDRDRASYIEEYFLPAEKQTEFLEGDQEILPGVRVEILRGHTWNLQGVWLESGGQSMLFISDLVPTAAHLPYPWIMSFDLYPLETLATRRRLLPKLLEQGTVVTFPHDARIPWARLVEAEGKITVAMLDQVVTA